MEVRSIALPSILDHNLLSNVGANTHVAIDNHIADSSLHFTEASIDHGSIGGLGDDDHTQYILADGSRNFTSNVTLSSAGDIELIIEADTDNSGENDNPTLRLRQDGNTNAALFGINGSPDTRYTDALGNAAFLEAKASEELQFVTGATSVSAEDGVARMTILSDGKIGIGTNAPTAHLHVSGIGDVELIIEADSDNTGEDDNPRLVLRQDGNLVNGLFGINGTTGARYSDALFNAAYIEPQGGNAFQIVTGATSVGDTDGTARMTIENGGNIGFGTNNPATHMHLARASSPELLIEETTNSIQLVARANSPNFAFIGTISNHPYLFVTNNTIQGIITNTGLFGINELSPGAMLEIETNSITEEGLKVKGSADQTGDLIIAADNSDNTGFQVQANFTVKNLGGRITNITEVTTSTYTVEATDYHISIQYTNTGPQTTTLPPLSADNHGQIYHFKDADYNAKANNITIAAAGADTIDESAAAIISNSGVCLTVEGNNTTGNWEIQ